MIHRLNGNGERGWYCKGKCCGHSLGANKCCFQEILATATTNKTYVAKKCRPEAKNVIGKVSWIADDGIQWKNKKSIFFAKHSKIGVVDLLNYNTGD